MASGALCDQAASQAARRTGVPESILKALTRTETGRRKNGVLAPWPWSMNVEGKGQWFASRADAETYLRSVRAAGTRNFDVGCFQINFRWHGTAFATPAKMFEPVENALYAARFLHRLYDEKGNWADAAAAYHSRTPKYASRYKARFETILANLGELKRDTPPLKSRLTAETQRANLYPLLRNHEDESRALGSLVPMAQTAQRSFLALGG
ncbi:MAG: lytic transglycosylase domain-containing protein [Rhodobacteraceae bacterium]|nr:lytic transglycosylase domain-containing protein [Paracoccaceae bacterium]